jgi:DNA-binding transcriptional LysR family regulator
MQASARPHNLDLATLRSFVTINETGSMTRAAIRLHMTQSAISMQIKRLEESLGFSVFDRSTQGMPVTPKGEQLLHFAQRMLALNDEVMGRLTSPDYEGIVRFAAPSDIVYPHIPDVLKAFSRDFPRVQLHFSTGSSFRLLAEYNRGRHDVVLTTERRPRRDSQILLTQPLVWTGALEGNAWKQRPLPIGFTRRCAFRSAVIETLDKSGIPWVELVVSEEDLAIEAMASADLCVHAELDCSEFSSRYVIDHGGQLPVLPEHSIALYHDASRGGPISQALADYLQHAYDKAVTKPLA